MDSHFTVNELQEAPSQSMRVFSYRSDTLNRQNPYYRYVGRFNRILSQKLLEQLLNKGNVIHDSDAKIETHPELCKRELKPHQKRLVYEMKQLENSPYSFTHKVRLGFLCDSVGTGKSLTMLALIMENQCPTGGNNYKVPYINPIKTYSDSRPYQPSVFSSNHPLVKCKRMNSTLIVIPHTIYSQWKGYIQQDTNLTTYLIHSKKKLNEFIDKVKWFVENPEQTPQVVLCKSTYYNTLVDSIEMLGEEYVNSVELERYECTEETSVEYGITRIPEVVQNVRLASRQLQSLMDRYRQGVDRMNDVADRLNDLTDYLASQQNIVQQVLQYDMNTSGQLVERIMIPKSGLLWNRVVFDEADTIPISSSRAVMAHMVWMISASYNSFLYPFTSPPPHRTGFIRNLIESQKGCYFYMQHCIFTSTKESIQESFPIIQYVSKVIDCLTPNHVRIAQRSNMRDVIDALNAGDTELALQICNCNTEQSESGLIESLQQSMRYQMSLIELKQRRVEEHLQTAECEMERIRSSIAELGSVDAMMSPDVLDEHATLLETLRVYSHNATNYTQTIQRYQIQLDSFKHRLESMTERMQEVMSHNCPICMDEIPEGKRAIVSCCNQTFCVDCILQQLATYRDRTTPCPCPMCRTELTPQSFTVLRSSTEEPHTTETLPSKEEALLQLLSGQNDGKRFLLFSGHDTTFRLIEPILTRETISFELLNGSDGSIQKKIRKWTEGKTRVLCLNSTVLGAGMNLPQATDVILYHKQIPDVEQQVIGRAQRPGRSSIEPLRVWKLSYENEYVNRN